ncbi:MAG TPA: hypothetical protein VGG41_19760 [Solirubrobacteraceae bacterium]
MRGTLGVVVVAACALAFGVASAAAYPPDPAANIALGPLPGACASAPRGSACEQAAIRSLDAARAKLGLGSYLLPRGFVKLAPARQWLILANLDRRSYHLRPISGLALPLDHVARQGAQAHTDPDPLALLRALPNQSMFGFASNWAGGQPNALVAYYGWMYDDGPGGENIDCSTPQSAGCWGHRHDILSFPSGGVVVMGAATDTGSNSYALTIVNLSSEPWQLGYTWAAAVRAGAGSR